MANVQNLDYRPFRMSEEQLSRITTISAKDLLKQYAPAPILMLVMAIVVVLFLPAISFAWPLFILGALISTGYGIYQITNQRRQFRYLSSFAQANGFDYRYVVPLPNNGFIFDANSRARLRDVVSGSYHTHNFWIGNYTNDQNRSLVSGKNNANTSADRGVIAIELPVHLPNVIFLSKSGVIELESLASSARLQNEVELKLEGNFNDYFRVLVPADSERDVLYFLTPEIMAKLIDVVKGYDLEIVENTLYIYRSNLYKHTEQDYAYAFYLVELLGSEFSQNTKNLQPDAPVAVPQSEHPPQPKISIESKNQFAGKVALVMILLFIGSAIIMFVVFIALALFLMR